MDGNEHFSWERDMHLGTGSREDLMKSARSRHPIEGKPLTWLGFGFSSDGEGAPAFPFTLPLGSVAPCISPSKEHSDIRGRKRCNEIRAKALGGDLPREHSRGPRQQEGDMLVNTGKKIALAVAECSSEMVNEDSEGVPKCSRLLQPPDVTDSENPVMLRGWNHHNPRLCNAHCRPSGIS